ncbi:MAG: FlgD immunoglobulin-like domain containing protein [Candidatus Eisenbacteria bacterium]
MIRFLLSGVALAFLAVPASAQSIRDDLWVTNGFVYTNTILGNTMYIGGLFTRIGPATGNFMPVDGTTGLKTLPALNVDGAVNAIVADGSGGFILGGSFKHYAGAGRASLARIDATGNLTSWNPGVTGIVKSLAIGGGRVYIGGAFSQVGGLARSNLAAVDLASGAVSTTWVPNADNTVHYVGYLNGLVYIGGEFFGIAGTQRAHGGSFDGVTGGATQWQPNTDGTIYSMALRYDVISLITTVYVGGSFTVCGGALRKNFALVDATPNSATFSSALNFDPSPDGAVRVIRAFGNTIPTIYVGGDFQNIAGNSRPHLAAFQGTTLRSFNPAPDGSVVELALSGSTLFIGGYFQSVDHALRGYAAGISTSTGTVVAWDAAAGNVVRAFAQSGSTMWIGGDFTTIGALARSNLAAIDLAGGAATTWNPGTSGPVYALEAIAGWLYAGGQFVALGGQGHLNIGRVDVNGTADTGWIPNTNLPVYAIAGRSLAPSGNVIYLGGPFTTCMGPPRNHLAAVSDAVPAVLSAWNPNAGSPGDVRTLAIDDSYVYAGGYFTSLGGQAIGGVGRVDFNGLVSPWNSHTTQPIQGITLTPTTVYIGYGGVNNLPGGPRIGVAELDKATALSTAWNPGTDPAAVVYTVRRNGGTVYIGGLIHLLGGQPRSMLGAVDAVSGTALPFDPAPSSWLSAPNTYYQLPAVIDMEENNGRMYAVGQFTNTGGKPHSGVAGIFESTTDVTLSPLVAAGIALRATPNPSSGDQALLFDLASPGRARLALYDVAGRLVRLLVDGPLPAGPQHFTWDGREASEARVMPGLYFVRLEAGKERATTKLLRID